jgi:hypothetical protein
MATAAKLGAIEEMAGAPEFAVRHYSVTQLAELWNLSPNKVREMFQHEPGVMAIGEPRPRFGRRRGKVTLRIPESVAERVYRRHCLRT